MNRVSNSIKIIKVEILNKEEAGRKGLLFKVKKCNTKAKSVKVPHYIMEGKRVQVGYLSGGEGYSSPKRKCSDCATRNGNGGFSFGSGRASFEYEYKEL